LVPSPERFPLEVLHDEVRRAAGVKAEIEDVDEARVLDHRRRARFVEEAVHHVRVAREFRHEDLHRRAPTDELVLREVHDAHPPRADLLEDAEAAERLADHRWTTRVYIGTAVLRKVQYADPGEFWRFGTSSRGSGGAGPLARRRIFTIHSAG